MYFLEEKIKIGRKPQQHQQSPREKNLATDLYASLLANELNGFG
jgi:hypothetical protein